MLTELSLPLSARSASHTSSRVTSPLASSDRLSTSSCNSGSFTASSFTSGLRSIFFSSAPAANCTSSTSLANILDNARKPSIRTKSTWRSMLRSSTRMVSAARLTIRSLCVRITCTSSLIVPIRTKIAALAVSRASAPMVTHAIARTSSLLSCSSPSSTGHTPASRSILRARWSARASPPSARPALSTAGSQSDCSISTNLSPASSQTT
mmetsp:Transcript_12945/g.31761  ORF Transcript_12945/g.31761 Transcript_12945/m.31761 type:complete len:209 (+) Transcript_12945:297-923(+)